MNVEHEYNAEFSVIGSILIDNTCIAEATARLQPDDFQHPICRAAFQAAYELCCEGKNVDAVKVLHKIGDTPEHREGLYVLAQCTPTAANFSSYVTLMEESRKRRNALTATYELTEALQAVGQTIPLDECQSMAGKIVQAFEDRTQRRAADISQLFDEFEQQQERPISYLRTGIQKLDETASIGAGHYVIIAGRPSSGKTALSLQLMLEFAKTRKVVFFSLETSRRDIFLRVLANYAKIPLWNLMHNSVDQKSHTLKALQKNVAFFFCPASIML